MKVKLAGIAIVSAIALFTSACGDDAVAGAERSDVVSSLEKQGIDNATATKMADLYEKAVDNGEDINFYGLAALPLQSSFDAFEKTFPGLKVAGTQLNAPDTITKVSSEVSSGRVAVGVTSGTVEVIGALHAQKAFDAMTPIQADQLADIAKDPAGYYAHALTPWGPVVPTDAPEGAVPTTWKQVASGDFEGSAAAVDPTITGLTAGMLTYLLDAGIIDEADVAGLAKSDYTGYADSGAALNAVGSGEKDLMLAHSYSVFAAQKEAGGLDLKFDFPLQDANITSPLFLALPKGAPNKAGSELLMNYLYSAPAQQQAVQGGYLPTLDGVDPGELFPPLADIPNPLAGPHVDDVAAVYEQWAPVLKNAFK